MSFRLPLLARVEVACIPPLVLLLALLFILAFSNPLFAQPQHGAAIQVSCGPIIRVCDNDAECSDANECTTDSCDEELAEATLCQVRVANLDEYNDSLSVDNAFQIIQAAFGDVRIPTAGDLPILSVAGNTDCVAGQFLPCTLGPDQGGGAGEVTFRAEGYNPTLADPSPLLSQAWVSFTDFCDSGAFDCNPNPVSLTAAAATTLVSGCDSVDIVCDDGDDCTSDFCDPALGCVHTPDFDCDDNDVCTTDICDPVTGCVNTPGALGDCDDGDACTTDNCDPDEGCVNLPVDCDDGDSCTIDTCDPILGCVNSPLGDCDDGDACTTDICDPIEGCVHIPADCDDGDVCTTDTCDPVTGCVNTPGALNCDDLNVCTTDTCDPINGCVNIAGALGDCDDNNVCTTDTCDPVEGCFNMPGALGDCDDGDVCTDDICDPVEGCVNTPAIPLPPECSSPPPALHGLAIQKSCDAPVRVCDSDAQCAGDACTVETCDTGVPGTTMCLIAVSHADAYGDTLNVISAYDLIDTASGGVRLPATGSLEIDAVQGNTDCLVGGFAPCSIGPDIGAGPGVVHFFAEGYDPTLADYAAGSALVDQGTVVFTDSCDSGAPDCNSAATFQATVAAQTVLVDGCASSEVVDCDDGDACTTDNCDPVEGCVNLPADCDDGDSCTIDTCDPILGCVNSPGPLGDCDDGDACTTDICDPIEGCVHIPADCDDGDVCTTDTCDPVTGCVNAPGALNCDDNDVCTTDTCDPVTGCVNAPGALNCDDNNVCTTDTCDPVEGCFNMPGALGGCDDGDVCTDDICDAVEGCVNIPAIPLPPECSSPPPTGHGIGLQKECDSPVRICRTANEDTVCANADACNPQECDLDLQENVVCRFTASYNDSYGDTIALLGAWDQIDPFGLNIRLPTAGNAEIIQVGGNTNCVVGGSLGCLIGPDEGGGSGFVVFEQDSFAPSDYVGLPNPLVDQAVLQARDNCESGDPACSSNAFFATILAQTVLVDGCQDGTPPNCDDGDVCTTDTCDPILGCVNTPGAQNCDDGDTCTDDFCDPSAGCVFIGNGTCNETPAGTDVQVDPIVVDENNQSVPDAPDVSITFDSVQTAGATTVVATAYEEGGTPPPPTGFKIGGLSGGPVIYDIETTADLAPGSTFEICFDYSSLAIAGDPADLALIHEEEGVWVDITSSHDTINRILCGNTDSFSFYAIVESVVIFELSDPVVPAATEVVLGVDVSDPPVADTVYWSWGDGESSVVTVTPGQSEVAAGHAYDNVGVYLVTAELWLTSTNPLVQTGSAEFLFVVVYDPSAGFVTGGGWIDSPEGALTTDPTQTGKAQFGFVSKYKKGAQSPSGNTEFQFQAGDLNFHSSSYDWLVIAGSRAQFKGSGTVNAEGDFGFLLTAVDADLTSSTDVDLFRIKIWDKENDGAVIYDNGLGDSDNSDPTTEIGGGSIRIHKDKK